MKWILLFLGIWGWSMARAQITYNKRVGFSCGPSVITSLLVTDSCTYLTGWGRDSSLGCQVAILWAKIDTLGNVLEYTLHGDTSLITETWDSKLQLDMDGNFMVGGNVFDTTLNAMLIKWDQQGNVLWQRRQGNMMVVVDSSTVPPTLDSATRTDDFVIAPDGSYLLAGRTYDGWQLTCFNRDRTIRWQRFIDCMFNYCMEHSILVEDDGFLVGYLNSDANMRARDYTFLCVLEKYDYAGNRLWRWQNDSSQQFMGCNDVMRSKDGGYVIASANNKELLNHGGTSTRNVHSPLVFKLDSNRNMVWQTPLRAYTYFVGAKINNLLELPDSTFMVFGVSTDSFTIGGRRQYQTNLIVAHLSKDGDSLWSEQYYYFGDQAYSQHLINDVERTLDGGYLCVGQAIGSGQGARQQGWLLKLDSLGCLVPGCRDTHNSISKLPSRPTAQVLLYPNPVQDYLNVHYRYPVQGKALTWRIMDTQGRVVREHHSRAVSEQTYIFEVGGLLAGWYVLEVVQDGVSLGREVFVKE